MELNLSFAVAAALLCLVICAIVAAAKLTGILDEVRKIREQSQAQTRILAGIANAAIISAERAKNDGSRERRTNETGN